MQKSKKTGRGQKPFHGTVLLLKHQSVLFELFTNHVVNFCIHCCSKASVRFLMFLMESLMLIKAVLIKNTEKIYCEILLQFLILVSYFNIL